MLAAGFVALGIWQVERRAWKHALIDAVETRSTAAPVAAPAPDVAVSAEADAYRRVRVTGRFLHDRETLVRAVSDLGSGYWVVTPLDTGGFTVLVNRGFVPPDRRESASRAAGNGAGEVTVTGLLRITEPEGGFLRNNDPAAGNWYSRDVAAISAAQGLNNAAPYFIDADAAPNPGAWPRGGLTVLRFSDNHLGYALTWFALALLSLGAIWLVLRKVAVAPNKDA
ncbi:SURF1 family protein [Sphingomonas sp. R647]|uniref:SURF1 family protein n=1 Tax=Sphingomonas sp. R647 TaxID=2875233 RepID=UPI001CD31D99|nr:SURF1 family protein [Sphingomonas sp. R647]MCA1199057.1 SURF1 family protein [Sphingomonas sp. R647]